MRVLVFILVFIGLNAFSQGFYKVPEKTSRIDFENLLVENDTMNGIIYPYLYNGGGVAIGDINNDGLEDIYFTGNQVDDKLYLNQGALKFKDVTSQYFKNQSFGYHTGVTMVDINNDGWLDIYVSAAGPSYSVKPKRNKLFINQEGKGFVDQAKDYGLDEGLNSSQTVFFDADEDGDLDALIINHSWIRYALQSKKAKKSPGYISGKDKLMINEGGRFTDKSAQFGLFTEGFSLGVIVSDFNNDFRPDFFLSSDFDYPDMLFLSTEYKKYKVTSYKTMRHISHNSVGVDAADLNNDGWMDLFSVDIAGSKTRRSNLNLGNQESDYFQSKIKKMLHTQVGSNSLQLNVNGSFIEIGQMAGVSTTGRSWATLFADFNLDGFQDIFVANGVPKDIRDEKFREVFFNEFYHSEKEIKYEDISELIPASQEHNFLYLNNKDLTFEDVSNKTGFEEKNNVTGAAYADLDNDGDLDLVCNAVNGTSYIMENKMSVKNNYLKIKLIGPQDNVGAVGAKVSVYSDENQLQREAYWSRGFQSSVTQIIHFGLISGSEIDSVVISWNRNEKTVLKGVVTNQMITVKKDDQNLLGINDKKDDYKPFTQMKLYGIKGLEHKELNPEFEDTKYNLKQRLSRMGPFVEVADVNNDGHEDFFFGGAKGQKSSLYYRNDFNGYDSDPSEVWNSSIEYEDMEAVFFDFDKDGDLDLYVVSGGNEAENKNESLQDRLYVNNGKGQWNLSKSSIPEIRESGKKVLAEDINGDGWTDLIVFGRQVPGAYPTPANSRILINKNGKFVDQTEILAPEFIKLGMVTDAICLDIDKDKDLDFVIVGEWMPVTIFENNNGVFENKTAAYRLKNTAGWWNSIDLISDQEESMSFILGNLGKNTPYQVSEGEPFALDLKNNLNANGTFVAHTFANSILAIYNGKASLGEMPMMYQSGPINTTIVHDFSGDGRDEIVCAGNFFELSDYFFRCDGNPIWVIKHAGDFENPFSLGTNLNIRSGSVIKVGDYPHIIFGVNDSRPAIFDFVIKF